LEEGKIENQKDIPQQKGEPAKHKSIPTAKKTNKQRVDNVEIIPKT
jgi:hypothetical protein